VVDREEPDYPEHDRCADEEQHERPGRDVVDQGPHRPNLQHAHTRRKRLTVGAAFVVLAAGCGGSNTAGQQQSAANVAELIDQLRGDLVLSAGEGGTLATARRELGDPSQLYGLLIAYTDFGGCRRMVGNVGVGGGRLRPVQLTLARACVYLERSATQFTRAAGDNDPRALLAAGRTARRAAALLTRARFELHRLRGSAADGINGR